jgi:hypothetical protein
MLMDCETIKLAFRKGPQWVSEYHLDCILKGVVPDVSSGPNERAMSVGCMIVIALISCVSRSSAVDESPSIHAMRAVVMARICTNRDQLGHDI